MSFYAKSVSFWANEWIVKYINKLMLSKLWGKVECVFFNINFFARILILSKKEKKCNFGRNVDFSHVVCTTTESDYIFAKPTYLKKNVTFCLKGYIH